MIFLKDGCQDIERHVVSVIFKVNFFYIFSIKYIKNKKFLIFYIILVIFVGLLL